jgi:hypothetical protein
VTPFPPATPPRVAQAPRQSRAAPRPRGIPRPVSAYSRRMRLAQASAASGLWPHRLLFHRSPSRSPGPYGSTKPLCSHRTGTAAVHSFPTPVAQTIRSSCRRTGCAAPRSTPRPAKIASLRRLPQHIPYPTLFCGACPAPVQTTQRRAPPCPGALRRGSRCAPIPLGYRDHYDLLPCGAPGENMLGQVGCGLDRMPACIYPLSPLAKLATLGPTEDGDIQRRQEPWTVAG